MTTASDRLAVLLKRQATSLCDELAGAVTDLMTEKQSRSDLPQLTLLAFTLAASFQRQERSELTSLASAIQAGFEHLFNGHLDPGQALPLLASAIASLKQTVPTASSSGKSASIAAAIYELETLFPLVGQEPPAVHGGPDVRLTQLRGVKKT